MNKIIFLTLLTLTISSSKTSADQAKIIITANVTDKTCTLSSAKKNFLVNLEKGNINSVNVGVPFSYIPFSIDLEHCSQNVKMVRISFNGESDPEMPNLLKNISAQGSLATGIAIGLYDNQKNNVDIRNNMLSFPINSESVKISIPFFAGYVKKQEFASAGKVKSVASFEISYD